MNLVGGSRSEAFPGTTSARSASPSCASCCPRAAFPAWDVPAKAKGTFSLHRVGSYLTPHGFVFQLWCPEVEVRRAAALERALQYDGEGRRGDEDLAAFLGRVSARLELDAVLTIADVTAYSRRTGRGSRGI